MEFNAIYFNRAKSPYWMETVSVYRVALKSGGYARDFASPTLALDYVAECAVRGLETDHHYAHLARRDAEGMMESLWAHRHLYQHGYRDRIRALVAILRKFDSDDLSGRIQ